MNSVARPRKTSRRKHIEFAALAETTSVAIFLVQARRIVYANPAAATITGYAGDDLLGREFWQLAHPHYQAALQQLNTAHAWVAHLPSR